MSKIFLFICRIVIGLTFIFSGFTKAVDPMGFAIKIEDYLIAFQMDWFSPVALPFAIFMIAVEFLFGFYLVIGFHVRIVAPLILILMSSMTLLTFYSAVFNPVSDCGCFGDAVKITNWQTFWKNVVLMIFTVSLFYLRKQYNSSGDNSIKKILCAIAGVAYIIGLTFYSYNNLPIMDFRPYKIGTHIASGMVIPDDAEQPEYETIFIMEKDGEKKTFTIDDYPYEDSTWVYVDTETKTIKKGYTPPLREFSLLDPEFGDVTGSVINHKGTSFLMIAPHLDKAKGSIKQFAELSNAAKQKDIPFYCVTASDVAVAANFDTKNNTNFDYLQCDETVLKTIIRSNPGLIMLYDGTVVGKWHFRNIPDKEIINNPFSYALNQSVEKNKQLVSWVNILLLIAISTILINRKNK